MITNKLLFEIATEGKTKKLLTRAIIEHGFAPDNKEVREKIKIIKQKQQARIIARVFWQDPLISAKLFRSQKAASLREKRALNEKIEKILSYPIAKNWRSDRKTSILNAYDEYFALKLAIQATLEAIPRIAKKWGFTNEHTSKHNHTASSRYLCIVCEKWMGKVRLSDHYLPETAERSYNYETFGAPKWGEIVISEEQLQWSLTRWKRELILCAAGRR